MFKSNYIFPLLLLFCFVTGAVPVTAHYNAVYTYSSNEVPYIGFVNGITQDSRGIIWVWGTKGVFYYDGSRFRKFSSEDGLLHQYCYKVVEHPDTGEIYICTYRGISIYNPVTGELHDHPTLRYFAARDLVFADSLMFVASDAGFYIIRRNGPYQPRLFDGITGDPLTTMAFAVMHDPDNKTIWVATERYGVFEVDYKKVLELFRFEDESLQKQYETDGTVFWPEDNLGDNSGSTGHFLIDDQVFRTEKLRACQKQYVTAEKPELKAVYNIFKNSDGEIFLYTPDFVYHLENGEFVKDPSSSIYSGQEQYWFRIDDRDRRFFQGENGLLIVDGDDSIAVSEKNGLPSSHIRASYLDRQNILWIVDSDGTLSRVSPLEILSFSGSSQYSELQKLRVLSQLDNGRLIIAGENSLLEYGDGSFHVLYAGKETLSGVQDVCEDGKGNLLVSQINQLSLFNRKTGKLVPLTGKQPNSLNNVLFWRNPDKSVWCVMSGRLYRWDGTRLKIIPLQYMGLSNTTCITGDGEGNIYLGSWTNILRLEPNSATLFEKETISRNDLFRRDSRRYKEKWVKSRDISRSFFQDYPAALCGAEGPDSAMWFGTFNAGIIRIKNDSVRVFDTRNGLPANSFSEVWTRGDGTLFFVYDHGIVQIRGNEPELYPLQIDSLLTIRQFRELDNGFHCVNTPDGVLVWSEKEKMLLNEGTGLENHRVQDVSVIDNKVIIALQRDGFFVFNPLDIAGFRTEKINPIVTSIENGQNALKLGKSIQLAKGERSLVFKFTLPDYINDQGNQFRWKLDGLDSEYNTFNSHREAVYNSIPSGKYLFRLLSRDGFGYETSMDPPISIVVPYHFYETFFFKIVLILLFVLGSILYVQLRTFQVRQSNLKLEQLVSSRTMKLEETLEELQKSREVEIEAEKLRNTRQLAATVAHELNNPLQVISGLAQLIQLKLKNEGNQDYRDSFRKINETIQRMKELAARLEDVTSVEETPYAAGLTFIDLYRSTKKKILEDEEEDNTENDNQD